MSQAIRKSRFKKLGFSQKLAIKRWPFFTSSRLTNLQRYLSGTCHVVDVVKKEV